MSGLWLLETTDAHFAWMLGERDAPDGLTLPPGGIDSPRILRWLRRGLTTLGPGRGWLMVADGEVVGTGGYKNPPRDGVVDIGYGVAAERRRRGHAAAALALIVEKARGDPEVRALIAETALANLPSQRVLEANGFAQVGRSHDDEEGEMIVWRLEL
ncbi:MAG TPA: GNAT family N-acetyltransferase [Caulobacteraceae bacterium]|jgi:RimJ/RimL family protein N-acetyltransferase